MDPHRGLPLREPDFRTGREGFFDGYESQTVRTYTVRDGTGTKKITERTVTTPDGKVVTHREEMSECPSLTGTFTGKKKGSGIGRLTLQGQKYRSVLTGKSNMKLDSGARNFDSMSADLENRMRMMKQDFGFSGSRSLEPQRGAQPVPRRVPSPSQPSQYTITYNQRGAQPVPRRVPSPSQPSQYTITYNQRGAQPVPRRVPSPSQPPQYTTTYNQSSKGAGDSKGEVNLKDFRAQALKAHNDRRSRHGVPALKLSSDLNDYAQKWAEYLVKNNKFAHSECMLKGERLGENIANKWSSAGTDYAGEEVTEQWYSEIKKHNFSSEQSMGTGHFTQVVWKDTKELGVGKAKDATGKVIVVASYRPAGNFIGQFTKNVFPPK